MFNILCFDFNLVSYPESIVIGIRIKEFLHDKLVCDYKFRRLLPTKRRSLSRRGGDGKKLTGGALE